jgi:hypothetical protein
MTLSNHGVELTLTCVCCWRVKEESKKNRIGFVLLFRSLMVCFLQRC